MMRPSQVIITLEDVVAQLPCSLMRNGTRLSSRDSETVKDTYLQWTCLLLDLGYLSCDDLEADAHRLLSPMLESDVFLILQSFSECLQEVYNGRLGHRNRGFKALCKSISPRLYNLIKADVIKASCSDIYSLRRLIQVFAYPSRLSLLDIDLTDQCLDDYKATELAFDDAASRSMTTALNRIIRRWFGKIDMSDLVFSHGPGGVAGLGRTSLDNKYLNLSIDPLISYTFKDYEVPEFPRYSLNGEILPSIRTELARVSSTIFVPKSYKTFRTISMEPPTLMYLQQGVWARIDHFVNRSRYLRDRIGFHDQTRNQVLAQEGSLNRKYATIDLSAASDSVSWQLVKDLFRGTPLLRYLVACRSTHTVLPDGTHMELKKFAPMGSALCFPIETIIFAAICEFVTREHNFSGRYSVFGDDIIVPTECVSDTFYVLESFGFRPNEDKSFFSEACSFRESCGGEFINGFDVTPLRISRKYTSQATDIGCIGISEMMNVCLSKGFRYLRSFLWRVMQRNKDFHAHFSPLGLLSENYSNFHLRRRWNRRLQRVEIRATQVVVRVSPRNEEIALFDSLNRKQERYGRPRRTYLDRLLEDYQNFVPFYRQVSENETGMPVVKTRLRWMAAPEDSSHDSYRAECISRFHSAELVLP